jgi:hypothetical protein
MGRNSTAKIAIAFITIVLISLMAFALPASASDSAITLSGQILYPGNDGVLLSPDRANVTARYMGQEYFTTSDSHGDYVIGPVDYGQEQIFEFKINYTDADGKYYVWPANGWFQTLVLSGSNIVQNMILIESTAPAPTPVPTAMSSPTAVVTPSPSPTPVTEASPTPAANATTPTPAPEPSATPAPTKTPSVLFGGAGALAVLALIGYVVKKKQ